MINKTLTLVCFALLVLASSCKAQYPNLEDGLYAEIVTNKGTMLAKLYYEKAPVTVANFVGLAEGNHPNLADSLKGKPFYDGIIFHRVMDKFMIQGGDPTGTGSGSPGFKFADEFHPELKHNKAGILSMANSGFGTNGSQFFITEKETPFLDAFDNNDALKNCKARKVGCHAVFGELVEGLDIQDSISNVKTAARNKPVEDVVIQKLNIIRKGSKAKAFNAEVVFAEEEPKLADKYKSYEDEREEKLKENATKAVAKFLEKNKDIKGEVKKFPSGLVMILDTDQNAKKPSAQEKVLMEVAGFFEDGQLFWTTMKEVAETNDQYSEQADKAGAYVPMSTVFNESAPLVPGFREAMLNMKIGDKAKVFIPSYLGYGAAGRAPRIPPNTNLVFDLELVGIDK